MRLTYWHQPAALLTAAWSFYNKAADVAQHRAGYTRRCSSTEQSHATELPRAFLSGRRSVFCAVVRGTTHGPMQVLSMVIVPIVRTTVGLSSVDGSARPSSPVSLRALGPTRKSIALRAAGAPFRQMLLSANHPTNRLGKSVLTAEGKSSARAQSVLTAEGLRRASAIPCLPLKANRRPCVQNVLTAKALRRAWAESGLTAEHRGGPESGSGD